MIQMSYIQKVVASPCLSEVGSWKLSSSSIFVWRRQIASISFSPLNYFPVSLKSHPGSRKKGFEFSATCQNAGVRSESQCFAREFPSLQFVFIQVGQNHPYTTHICFVFECIVPLFKFSISFFLNPFSINKEGTRTFFLLPK